MADLPKEFRSGDPLTADLLDAILRELWRWRKLGAAPPLVLHGAEGGAPPILALSAAPPVAKAVLSGALATGTLASPATANATLYSFNQGAWSTAQRTIKVYNSYALSASIASGKQIDVYRQNGAWHLLQAAC